MAFFCCQPKTGAVIIGFLNLTIGLLIYSEFLVLRIHNLDSLAERMENLWHGNGSASNLTDVTPIFDTIKRNHTGNETVEDEDCNWGCYLVNYSETFTFYVGISILLTLDVLGGLTSIASGFDTKFRKTLAHAAAILTAALLGCSFGYCFSMFIFGQHWIDLLLMFLWGSIIQIYFTMVLLEHHKSTEFQRVPVSA